MAIRAGYSGKPLWQKLGLKEGSSACWINAPENLLELYEAPFSIDTGCAPFDFVHAFYDSADAYVAALPELRSMIRPDATIWVSWPKKASGVVTDLTETIVRDEALKTDLVDVKICAVDATWSGLKLVVRKALR